jgi:hypothetical protein
MNRGICCLRYGWLQRAEQCGVITDTTHLYMLKRFSAKGWLKNEPGDA